MKSILAITTGLLCLTWRMGICGSCLDHPWYKEATVEEHWALLNHRIDPRYYRIVAEPEKVSRAASLLELVPAVRVSAKEATALVGRLPEALPNSSLFLIRGIRYPTSSGQVYVYGDGKAVMVGFSYLGPAELSSILEAPIVAVLPRLPEKVYVGCSGAS